MALHAADAVLTLDQKEEFLKTAKIIKTHASPKGVTNTVRVTLSDGTTTHDASVQTIDEYKAIFKADDGKTEMNFKDTYKFNIAGWRLARLLGLDDMVPPSVERSFEGKPAAYTWWIEDVMMDEVERTQKKMHPPDPDAWNRDMWAIRVYDQLIFNTDRNLTNLLIDKEWRPWMIDHSRAFRTLHSLLAPKNLADCDRTLLQKMKGLDEATLEKELMPYLTKPEVKGILARRDVIVKYFESKGDSVMYDRPRRTAGAAAATQNQ